MTQFKDFFLLLGASEVRLLSLEFINFNNREADGFVHACAHICTSVYTYACDISFPFMLKKSAYCLICSLLK